jgi:hypothetical protein
LPAAGIRELYDTGGYLFGSDVNPKKPLDMYGSLIDHMKGDALSSCSSWSTTLRKEAPYSVHAFVASGPDL